jgi:CheY-like chemotaxis protein
VDDPLHIVLIEDDLIDAEAVRRSFGRLGLAHALHHALTVETGVELVGELHADGHARLVVLLDLNLPGEDGHAGLQRLIHDPQTAMVPVLILTTSEDARDRHRAFTGGAAGYFVKPLDSLTLDRILLAIHDYWSVSCFPPNDHGNARPHGNSR